jgi:hypothetical protein
MLRKKDKKNHFDNHLFSRYTNLFDMKKKINECYSIQIMCVESVTDVKTDMHRDVIRGCY